MAHHPGPGHLCPDRLKFPPPGEKYTPEQVIQQAIEGYMNGGRHGDDREPLAEFVANELRLHGMGWEDTQKRPPLPQTCSACGRERTLQDAYDYNPLQAMTGKPLGWYSGDDGEMCPQCMTESIRGE
jgi:hypothetical protein